MLLPLVNVPLIEYTLQWLAAAEVEEVMQALITYFVHVYCRCDVLNMTALSATTTQRAQSDYAVAGICVLLCTC